MISEIRDRLFYNPRPIVIWRTKFPRSYEVKTQLYSYKSSTSIKEFDNKLYVDETYGYQFIVSEINYARLYGNWEIASYNEDDKFVLKLIDTKSRQFIELIFPTITDGICFINELYADKEVMQIGRGINIENITNKDKKFEHELKDLIKLIPNLLMYLLTIFLSHKISKKGKEYK